jgi:hypothetical protein
VKPTRTRTLLLIAVLAAAVSWALLTVVYAQLPPLSWTGVPALLIAAAAEAWTGRDLRNRIHGRPGAKPAPPLFVVRVIALAKATSLTTTVIAGVCLGFMGYLSSNLNSATERSDLVTACITFAASLILLSAALFLEYCCRVPKNPETGRDHDDDPAPPRPSPFHN